MPNPRQDDIADQMKTLDELIAEGEPNEDKYLGVHLTLESLRSYRKELEKRYEEAKDWTIDSG